MKLHHEKIFQDKEKIDMVSFLCYVHLILYELTCNRYMYSEYIPNILDAYLANFKFNDARTTIMNGVGITICLGIINYNPKYTFILCSEKNINALNAKK